MRWPHIGSVESGWLNHDAIGRIIANAIAVRKVLRMLIAHILIIYGLSVDGLGVAITKRITRYLCDIDKRIQQSNTSIDKVPIITRDKRQIIRKRRSCYLFIN